MASSPITSWQIDGETVEIVTDFIFLVSKITADGASSHEMKSYDQPRQHIKKHYFANKGPPSQSYGFSSSHIWMWEFDCKESWALKNLCFWNVVFEKTLESPLDCKESKLNPKGNQSWGFNGRTDAEVETPIFWLPDTKNWLIDKDPNAGKDWRQEEKRMREDKMFGCHHWLDGHEIEQAEGVGDGQGSLVCCSPWSRRVRHDCATEMILYFEYLCCNIA